MRRHRADTPSAADPLEALRRDPAVMAADPETRQWLLELLELSEARQQTARELPSPAARNGRT